MIKFYKKRYYKSYCAYRRWCFPEIKWYTMEDCMVPYKRNTETEYSYFIIGDKVNFSISQHLSAATFD